MDTPSGKERDTCVPAAYELFNSFGNLNEEEGKKVKYEAWTASNFFLDALASLDLKLSVSE